MDEMTAVRELLHRDSSWSPESVDLARARLTEAIEGSTGGPPRSAQRRTARRWGWSVAGTGVLAAAAAVAIMSAGSATVPPVGSSPASAPQGIRELLLAAAERAEHAAAGSGKYWHVKQVIDVRMQTAAGYEVTERRVQENWTAAAPGDRGWYGEIKLGVRPSTPADEQAWRADGSPAQWQVGPLKVQAAAQKPELFSTPALNGSYFGENELSQAEILALPTAPEQLRTTLAERLRRQAGLDPHRDLQLEAFGGLTGLLADAPASPAVRAAAFRALAAIPHVRNEGETRDSLGRVGVRLVYELGNRRTETIIDPAGPWILARKGTGRPTTTAKRVTKVGDTVWVTAEWTDAEPVTPTAP